jgi:hypothetical protein
MFVQERQIFCKMFLLLKLWWVHKVSKRVGSTVRNALTIAIEGLQGTIISTVRTGFRLI